MAGTRWSMQAARIRQQPRREALPSMICCLSRGLASIEGSPPRCRELRRAGRLAWDQVVHGNPAQTALTSLARIQPIRVDCTTARVRSNSAPATRSKRRHTMPPEARSRAEARRPDPENSSTKICPPWDLFMASCSRRRRRLRTCASVSFSCTSRVSPQSRRAAVRGRAGAAARPLPAAGRAAAGRPEWRTGAAPPAERTAGRRWEPG